MEAHVRLASYSEKKGFFRPFVCTAEGKIAYFYRPWLGTVTDLNETLLFTRTSAFSKDVFVFPDGTSLRVQVGSGGLVFDSCELKEQWPTPTQRVFVAGKRLIRVKPEDDTLIFDFIGDRPPMDMAMMAFFIQSGEGNGSAN